MLVATWSLGMALSELFEQKVGYASGFFGGTLGVSIANLFLAILLLIKKDKAIAFVFYFNAFLQFLLVPLVLNPSNWDSDIMWPKHLSLTPMKIAFGLLIAAQVVVFFKAWLWDSLAAEPDNSQVETKGPFDASDHFRF